MNTMLQVVLSSPEVFENKEVDIPEVQKGQVLLKIRAVGICGSDIHTYYGKHPFVHTPIVLGHEVTGEVVLTGEDVKKVSVGDRVVLRPQRTCGKCRSCREGRYNICKELNVLGCLSTGASSEYFAVEESILYKLPSNLGFVSGTMIEPLAVGVHALRAGGFRPGCNVLVTGAGTIGNFTAQAAKALGAKTVMITDVSDQKLAKAQQSGIDHTINVKDTNLKDAVKNMFPDDSLDLIMECSASEIALNQVIDLAPKGINIVLEGVFEEFPRADLASVQDKELSLIGTLMYTDRDYVEAISLAKIGSINFDPLISKTFDLAESADAYKYIENNRDSAIKVVLTA